MPRLTIEYVYAGLLELYKADQCLSDAELNRFAIDMRAQSSKKRRTGFELYSDRVTRLYPTYKMDRRCRPRPSRMTPVLNFYELRRTLLGPPPSDSEEPKEIMFLDGHEMLLH